jgi:glycosyltransferase involved in cell wall biosynthesis
MRPAGRFEVTVKMGDEVSGKLSVVIPAYNEEELIALTASALTEILDREHIPFELLFVDDGSRDGTWGKIQTAAEQDKRVRGVSFSRNFGKESAIFAGLANAEGDCCAVMDCDLQHPPEKLVEMYRLWQQGYEIVEGVKSDRGKESPMRRLGARCFYKIISSAIHIDMSRASDFKLMDRKAVDVLLTLREKYAFFRALSSWVGYKTAEVEFDVRERAAGKSKWSRRALTKYAVTNITSFSTAPMQIVTFLGVIMLIVSLVLTVIALVQKISGTALGGFTTVIIVQLFSGSVIMISLGIIGYYIAKIYEEIKGRPRFIVSATCGKSEHDAKITG